MDLRYVAGRNRRLFESLQSKDYDLESLFNASKEFMRIVDNLELNRKEGLSFVERLKDAYDESNGKEVEVNMPSKKRCRDRVSVENTTTNQIFLFRHTQNPEEFECEDCSQIVKFDDKELIAHVKTSHN